MLRKDKPLILSNLSVFVFLQTKMYKVIALCLLSIMCTFGIVMSGGYGPRPAYGYSMAYGHGGGVGLGGGNDMFMLSEYIYLWTRCLFDPFLPDFHVRIFKSVCLQAAAVHLALCLNPDKNYASAIKVLASS